MFYRQERGGIVVSRILHQRMLPERHAISDQDDDSNEWLWLALTRRDAHGGGASHRPAEWR